MENNYREQCELITSCIKGWRAKLGNLPNTPKKFYVPMAELHIPGEYVEDVFRAIRNEVLENTAFTKIYGYWTIEVDYVKSEPYAALTREEEWAGPIIVMVSDNNFAGFASC